MSLRRKDLIDNPPPIYEVFIDDDVCIDGNYDPNTDEDDEDYVCEKEEELSSCEDWSGSDTDYEVDDENVKTIKHIRERDKKKNKSKHESQIKKATNHVEDDEYAHRSTDDGSNSDAEFDNMELESEDEREVNHPIFKPERDMHDPPLACGLVFSNFVEFKDAVRNWNIKRGRQFKFVKNNKIKVTAKCKVEDCNWMIYARRMDDKGGYVEVKSYREKHTCPFKYNNKCVKSSWVAKRYSEVFRDNPKLDAHHFRKQVMKENAFYLSKTQGYRARRKALRLVHGSENDQYDELHDYAAEIMRSNPGSTVVIKMIDGYSHPITKQPRFHRMYVCFAAVKQGFLAGCRPWFGLDGTFLKGPCGGILLTAVGTDPNNGYFPIAFAATEGENTESWTWFLQLLKKDLQISLDHGWTIMSDKQKGLIQACDIIFPNAEHRFCVKHLHSNWSNAGFRGETLRKALWAAAKATTPAQFEEKLQRITEIDSESLQWLTDKPPCEWSRSYFRITSTCDMLLNNLCESFNSKILKERESPIVSMFEGLRIYIMERMYANRDMARSRWQQNVICPRIFHRLESNSKLATLCVPHKANDDHVEVWCPYGEQYAVDIKKHSCSCRKWDLTGVPCVHAISAIWTIDGEPIDYIHECYSVEKYLQCYEPCIYPLNGRKEWQKIGLLTPLPPLYARAPGRPKKVRRRNETEIIETKEKTKKLRRFGKPNNCSFCGEKGHNKRSCKVLKKSRQTESASQKTENIVSSQGLDQEHRTNKKMNQPVRRRKAKSSNQIMCSLSQHEELGTSQQVSGNIVATEGLDEDHGTDKAMKQPVRRWKSMSCNQIMDSANQQQISEKSKEASVEEIVATKEDNISCSAPVVSYKDKYNMFGLVAPPFPISSQPTLTNRKKKMDGNIAIGEVIHSSAEIMEKKITDESISKERIAGMRSVYEKLDIVLPPMQGEKNESLSSKEDATQRSVYERFGIPVPNFLGGNFQDKGKGKMPMI